MARGSKAARAQRARRAAAALARAYPRSTCALEHEGAFQLLVATVLSAQATDTSVNRATPELFRRFPTPQALAEAEPEELERVIGGIGLWRSKARNLRLLGRMLEDAFGGEVPRTVEDLVRLPGVGRKTATAVIGTAFGTPAGVTVDTHMLRINRLLGLSTATDPDRMSAELEALLPPEGWTAYTHRVIDHGRLVCVARRPRCGVCPLKELCASAFDPKAGYKPTNDEREPASAKAVSWVARSP